MRGELERLQRQLNEAMRLISLSLASDTGAVADMRERGLLDSGWTGGINSGLADSGGRGDFDSAFGPDYRESDVAREVFSPAGRQVKEAAFDIGALKGREIKRWFRSEGIRLIKEAQAEGYLD